MREIAVAVATSGALIALAIAVTGRLQVAAYASPGGARTVITNTWTGNVQYCTTIDGRTACVPVGAP